MQQKHRILRSSGIQAGIPCESEELRTVIQGRTLQDFLRTRAWKCVSQVFLDGLPPSLGVLLAEGDILKSHSSDVDKQ